MSASDQIPIPTVEESLWTASQVARYLNVSRSWVYRESTAGRLPCRRILSLVRFDPSEIRALRERAQCAPARLVNPFDRADT